MKISNTTAAVYGILLFLFCVVLPIVVFPLCINYAFSHMNKVEKVREAPNPNHGAIVTELNFLGCAVSSDATEVVIRRFNEPFDLGENSVLFSLDGIKQTKVIWVTNTHLEIQHAAGEVYSKVPQWFGVTVTYSEMKP